MVRTSSEKVHKQHAKKVKKGKKKTTHKPAFELKMILLGSPLWSWKNTLAGEWLPL